MAAVSYILKEVKFEYESQAAINAKIESIEEIYHVSGMRRVKTLLQKYDNHDYNYFYFLRDPNNEKSSGNLDYLPDRVKIFDQDFVMFKLPMDTLVHTSGMVKNHKKDSTIMARIYHFSNGYDLIIGRNIEQIDNLRLVVNNFLWIVGALLISIVLISFFISDYVVRKINVIGKTAEKIRQTGDLSRRIRITTKWDDLSNLAVILNEMLSDIENLLEGVKHVSDNIAHDLRSPLTRIKNQVENLNYAEIKDSSKLFGECKNNLAKETDQLLNTFNALLKISYLETGKSKASFVETNLKELINDAIELYLPVAEEKMIEVESDLVDLRGYVDRDLFFQALINLIDNAIKYTPSGGKICVFLRKNLDGTNLIEICDSGIGISDLEKQNVFKRFYRLDKSRKTKGNGLGLSLVSAVIKAHKGKIKLRGNNPGLVISITI